jgi:uncharacterized protein
MIRMCASGSVGAVLALLLASPAALAAAQVRGDFEIVDCLLPGQMRTLGIRSYLAQRQPTQTTASDCRIRGGEYVAYDRADLRSALNVWLETANGTNKEAQEAQVHVGEIYERGIGGPPDYAQAAVWYGKAAALGSSQGKLLLGALYERGLGVERDALKAVNLYREASGIKSELRDEEMVGRMLDQQRGELQAQIDDRDVEIKALDDQVKEMEAKLRQQAGAAASVAGQVAVLRRLVTDLRAQRDVSVGQLAKLPSARTREPGAAVAVVTMTSSLPPREISGLKLGRYYALVIGNQNYSTIESLQTPRSDAARAATLLRDRYGFNVQVLQDADDVSMLRALNDLNAVLRPEDNLLIYYAGHGMRLQTAAREAGYWLPVNAEAPPKDTFWVPNEQITAHLGRLPARRILVVADSCYAGLLSEEPGALFQKDPGAVSLDYVRFKLPKRARLLISSGGDKPVLDEGAHGNSVFSRAFLDVLDQNQGVLSVPALFVQLKERVRASAARSGFRQVPELKAIKAAGHEIGDFFFVPTRK